MPTLGALFVLGAIVGPPLDSLHSGIGLLIYDKFPVTIGALHGPKQYAGWHSCFRRNQHVRQRHVSLDHCPSRDLCLTGSWKTSWADAPLLGLYYAVGGAILLALDDVWGTTETKRRIAARCTPGWVALSFG